MGHTYALVILLTLRIWNEQQLNIKIDIQEGFELGYIILVRRQHRR